MARQVKYDADGRQIDLDPIDRGIGESEGNLTERDEKMLRALVEFAGQWHRAYYRAPEDEESSWLEEMTDELTVIVEEFGIPSPHGAD
jgi:hypothetical protein